MSEYGVVVKDADLREAGKFLSRALNGRHKRGVDAQQALFVVISAFNIVLVQSMREAGFDESEIKSIVRQAADAGLNAVEVPDGVN